MHLHSNISLGFWIPFSLKVKNVFDVLTFNILQIKSFLIDNKYSLNSNLIGDSSFIFILIFPVFILHKVKPFSVV